MWFWRRLLNITWKEKRTNRSILEDSQIAAWRRIEKKVNLFRPHHKRKRQCTITLQIIEGKVEGKNKKRGGQKKQRFDNIK